MSNGAAQAAPAPAKELPPLLRARLAKRGILPQVPAFAVYILLPGLIKYAQADGLHKRVISPLDGTSDACKEGHLCEPVMQVS